MNNYLLKRILLFFPAFAAVLVFTMVLGHMAGEIPPEFYDSESRKSKSDSEIKVYIEEKGLKEPFFYFSIGASEIPLLNSALYIPKFSWNGSGNRFHRYIKSVLDGSLGYSEYHNKKVSELIYKPFLRTLILNLFVIIITYGLGLYLGYFQSINDKPWLEKLLDGIGQFFYAIPSFWLAILLIWIFANRFMIPIFPMKGWNWDPSNGMLQALTSFLHHLFLPVFCLSIGSVAYLASVFYSGIRREMQKGYFKMAIAKGLSRKEAIRKHVFKNAIIPVVAISSGILPALISGSVIIESIFGIPGMGKLAFDSFLSRDYSTIYAITIIAMTSTWINWIIADYIYSRLDPRIRF
jgi:peptide/nickel transport system permease protein